MAEPFKNLVNPALVRAAVPALQRAWPAFDGERFVALACDGLEALELKARAMHVCTALEATLPADFAAAADVIEAALAPAEPADADLRLRRSGPIDQQQGAREPAGSCGPSASTSRATARSSRSVRWPPCTR